jgi:hypothetical protein
MTSSTHLGAGLVAPDRTAGAAPAAGDASSAPRTGRGRQLLVGAALLSPLALGVQYALSAPGLARSDAATWLGAIAEHPVRESIALAVYLVGMVAYVAVAAMLVAAGRRRAPVVSAAAATLLTIGAIGGAGFAGIRLVAVVLADSGNPAAVPLWEAVQTGAPFDVLTWFLGMAIVGTLVAAAALVRARADVTVFAGPAYLVGFVLSSGEFPSWVSVVGAVVQFAALLPVARAALRA